MGLHSGVVLLQFSFFDQAVRNVCWSEQDIACQHHIDPAAPYSRDLPYSGRPFLAGGFSDRSKDSKLVFLARSGYRTILSENQEKSMIEDTIGKIEAKIQGADAIKEDRRRELVELLGTLKSEVAELSKTHGEQAQSIAGFAEVSTHEATRTEQNPDLLKLSLQGLSSSVAELRESHPRLVQIVNTISNTLSNLGI